MIFRILTSFCFLAALAEGQTGKTASTLTTSSLLVVNNCPTNISVYQNGQQENILPTGANFTIRAAKDWSGSVYTDANGGTQTGFGSVLASFYGEVRVFITHIPPLCNGLSRSTTTGLSKTPHILIQG